MVTTSKGQRHFTRAIRLKLDKDSNALFFFHLCAFLLFLFGLCWHLKAVWSSGTTRLFKFLQFFSFWSYLVQFTALLVSNLTHLFPKVTRLCLLADILSSSVFAICNVDCVTYCLLQLMDSPAPDMSFGRPLWLAVLMRGLNAFISFIDVLVAERTFRQEGFWVSMSLPVAYVGWIVPLAVFFRKGYPYPFLNNMSQPRGIIVVSLVELAAIYGFYEAGAHLVGGSLRERGRFGSAKAIRAKKKRNILAACCY